MSAFSTLLGRELTLGRASGAATAVSLAFFLLVVTLIPFAVGPAPQVLARIAAGVIWVAALLAALLSLDRLLQPDVEDGTLQAYAVTGISFELLSLTKIASHWLLTGLPLILMTPIAAVLLQLPLDRLALLMLGLLIGTPALSALATLAASLTVGLKRGGGVLASLLVLPLTLPVLIFGVSLPDPLASDGALKLLSAAALFSLAVCPFAAGAALRLALD
jgi:heme exporter protein B